MRRLLVRGGLEEFVERIEGEEIFSIKELKALEEGNFKILPALPFAKGFVRSYSAYLKLDPDQMVQLFLEEKAKAWPLRRFQLQKRIPFQTQIPPSQLSARLKSRRR